MASFLRQGVLALALVLPAFPVPAAPREAVPGVQVRFADPDGVIVVAHRGCHNPAPRHGLGPAPENSLLALEHCVTIGADVMETDVLRTADGHLVMIHDDSVDRTTNGTGRVATLSLAQLRALRLRQNLGGAAAPLTDEHIVTLDEMLAAARGRILLNLDIKAAIYPEVIEAVVRAGAQDRVFIKTEAGIATPPLAGLTPYDRVAFMPILLNVEGKADLAAVLARQLDGKRPIGAELPRLRAEQLSSVAALARRHRLRLLVNTIFEGFVEGAYSDLDALRDPAAVWGRLLADGVTVFQTDEPEALLAFRASLSRAKT
ncbi:glycerophosphodiester phosphodiesterase [Sphingomonas sp. ABOLD]|uniref:Glycerophosphoryl diester phosphodiesterase n=1 Tax=Sphingomonas trueperi TaxID=53317 RepID=A0A7X5Y3I7_9SPHN|nr:MULTISPECIES: glycerophosphodiester phosphodiesterase family protein [Sphingomonas]NJC00001.1 glycerophosphoryl diester phosphodiesterase [Sphingomonas trueperi]RSV37345.1 glycerophosphodiester phosphodiesterase [Sphingomonas sp. ABOLD]RSV38624.1 glycerophosphodiester phosphodiesterase [Sphingomonas sp. ABOLE]